MTAPTPQLIAVDLIVIDGFRDGVAQRVLLIKRLNPPFQDHYALPGGFIEPNETVEQGALRELKEETGIDGNSTGLLSFSPRLIGLFSDPLRDPRGRVISAAFLIRVLPAAADKAKAGDDAKALEWVETDRAFRLPLAFDHAKILFESMGRF